MISFNNKKLSRWMLRLLMLALANSQFSILHSQLKKDRQFFNLTAEEVKIDSVLPHFVTSYPLGTGFADSVYSVSIEYPEFIDMGPSDVKRYQTLTDEPLPSMPVVESWVSTSRREGMLWVRFVPLVFRDGKYQKLVSFMLRVNSEIRTTARRASANTDSTVLRRYADHSVLATGSWAKISVTETGIHQLTDAVVRQAGFTNINKVKVYGYGGALQPEVLTGDYLTQTDDLKEVPTYTTPNGRRLFYAVGPVSWSSATATSRTRNPYSNYGYYFLTESDEEPLAIDSTTFVQSFYPSNNDYHSLYEVDDYAWYHSGRNLYDSRLLSAQETNSYTLQAHSDKGKLTVVLTSNASGSVSIALNDSVVGSVDFSGNPGEHSKAMARTSTISVGNLNVGNNTVTLRQTAGSGDIRLDYIALTQTTPAPLPNLGTDALPQPKFVYNITNQDHHADPQADLIIIVPTSQKLTAQAQRLKQLHEQADSMRVNLVPADELFNEFSSGTPDANAYRRYLKMLYDRAQTDADLPRYLLLFGDGAWDNRMVTSDWQTTSPDDFLLCYESENSFSETDSYVSDDYYCLLDDGEGAGLTGGDTPDVGVGRLPARTDAQAKILVDKTVGYSNNENAGDWQNIVCFMGDDGNNNVHMYESNAAAEVVENNYQGYNVKRFFWDAYNRVTTSTGNGYPDVRNLILQQMQSGALIMDYCGHGAPYSISHEKVLLLADFAKATSQRLPLWVTASCDISPYDTQVENIGETAMLNSNGGSIAFFGTTRTVWTTANKLINCAFIEYVLGETNGQRNRLGDAVRLAKCRVMDGAYPYNKLHYVLLGDPALMLAAPTQKVVIDSVNGQSVSAATVNLSAGSLVTVKGHIDGNDGFNGVVSLTVKDVEELVYGKMNDTSQTDTAYVFRDRPNTIYVGTDSVKAGHFEVTFPVPLDVSYTEDTDKIIAYAVSTDKQQSAHGDNEGIMVSVSTDSPTDGIGPSIYCYLNSPGFTNGGDVNATPYFYAELSDKDGINASGNALGHNLELVVDGKLSMTYDLNEYFQYDFGDYRSGTVGFSIPELDEGAHKLLFRAWDTKNNSSVAQLDFSVAKSLQPKCFSVSCTKNPATTTTTFIVSHDRAGSQMSVVLEVFDMSGRQLWQHAETGVPTDSTYTLTWNLTADSGNRLHTGVYLYRVLLVTEGSTTTSSAQKLIIL